ncbi:histone-fold-containing protein [Dioszegia hungarica]|uniref:Histone-fold-containing protein n=1 Tax=Dioszegia hungarica TaxID=4972 RepID=A0AA38H4Q5_9TREE|nr:histone-fold-containing protein [Dioszegia hungarica]KAI9633785.1 histone-fold-containing protein [Dioszegia hungarica]
MEVEYEPAPMPAESRLAGPSSYSDDEDDADVDAEAEAEAEVEAEEAPGAGAEDDAEAEEEEEEDGGEAQAAPKAKAKRVIKSRQSLAEKQPGTTLFPIARVKKIIKADKDVDTMSAEATFLIAAATEYFIKHFMEEGYTKARLDKRKIVNYRDMASVVARSDEFSFLQDVIPMPMQISEALEKRKQKKLRDENPTIHDEDPSSVDANDTLPALTGSKNPLFPNAVIRRPTNTHAKGSTKGGAGPSAAGPSSDLSDEDELLTGGVKPTGTNGTPSHQHGTRRARQSAAATEMVADSDEESGAQGTIRAEPFDDEVEPMDED